MKYDAIVPIYFHKKESGIINISAGIMSAIGMALILAIRSPAAIVNIPPQAIKSIKTEEVIIGSIMCDRKKSARNINICGITIKLTVIPSVLAKINAVQKSRTDFEISMEESPLSPSVKTPKTPKIPNPLAKKVQLL